MALHNTTDSYGWLAKLFHWLIALLIIGMLCVGLWMVGLGDAPERAQIYGLHKATGAVILFLVCARLAWRLKEMAPALPAHMPRWERLAADASHYALYAFMFIMPLSGWAMSNAAGYPVSVYGLFNLPMLVEKNQELRVFFDTLHTVAAYALIGLLCLHVAAALKHHFIDKDNVLKRMLPGTDKTL